MTDPFKLLVPTNGKTQSAEVRVVTHDHNFMAWRAAHILMPDMYLVDKDYVVPNPLAEDGQPMTPERRIELMKGKKPMFEARADGDNSLAKATNEIYVKAFDNDIKPEQLGESAVNNRPKVLKLVPPIDFKPNLEITLPEETTNVPN